MRCVLPWAFAFLVSFVSWSCGPLAAQISCGESFVAGLSPNRDPDNAVVAQGVFDLGSGPELIIVGGFSRVADVPAWRAARFDGTSWTAVGTNSLSAVSLQFPTALTVCDLGTGPRIYVAGKYYVPGQGGLTIHVGRWDGSGWTLIGAADRQINVLRGFADAGGPVLVAAGYFNAMSGVAAPRIARWNGTAWSSFAVGLGPGSGVAMTGVNAVEAFDDGAGPRLYAGGLMVPGPGSCPLAKWTGTQWVSAAPAGLHLVWSLCVHAAPGETSLVVGGMYLPGALPIQTTVAKWSGSVWTALAASPSANVYAVASLDDGSGPAIYVGGAFTSIKAPGAPAWIAAQKVARIRGSTVETLGTGLSGDQEGVTPAAVSCLSGFPVSGVTRAVAGGLFFASSPFDPTPRYLAAWDGAQWIGLTNGFPSKTKVSALTTFDDGSGSRLYAAGDFHTIGDVVANGFARFDGVAWEGLGAGLAGMPIRILTMAVFDDGSGPALYLAGYSLSTPGGPPGAIVARWNGGSSFTSIGAGLAGVVQSLAVWDDGGGSRLWAGGIFTCGGSHDLARWNGAAWQGLEQIAGIPSPGQQGSSPSVSRLLAEPGGGLVVAGQFTSIGNINVGNIVRILPGFGLDALGGGMVQWVPDVASLHDGTTHRLWGMTSAPTPPSLAIQADLEVRRFDGTTWVLERAVPGGQIGVLRTAPDVGGEALYLGVDIMVPFVVSKLERFAAGSWTTVVPSGAKVSDVVHFADAQGGGLAIAGRFDALNGVPSAGVGRLRSDWATITKHPSGASLLQGQPVQLVAKGVGKPPLAWQWYRNGGAVPGATSSTLSIPAVSFADAGSYEAVLTNSCGPAYSRLASLAVRGCDLAIGQPFGPGVIRVGHSGGPPSARVFTAFSLAPQFSIPDAVAQFLTQAVPFVTTLSASGTSAWASPLPPSLLGVDVWGVSTLYDPATLTTIGSPSNVAHAFLQ
jgi:hypothetical protein